MLGFPDLPLRMTAGVFQKIATGKDGERDVVPLRVIARLPELIDEPMALFDSASVQGALVALTTSRVASGVVIAAVLSNARDANTTVNLVTSVYAKERSDWFAEQVRAGRLRYADEKKGSDILEVSGLALDCGAEPGNRNPSARKVLRAEDLRNFRTAQRAARLFSLVD